LDDCFDFLFPPPEVGSSGLPWDWRPGMAAAL